MHDQIASREAQIPKAHQELVCVTERLEKAVAGLGDRLARAMRPESEKYPEQVNKLPDNVRKGDPLCDIAAQLTDRAANIDAQVKKLEGYTGRLEV